MSAERKRFHEAFCEYISETYGHLNTVRRFCELFPRWMVERERELEKIKGKIQLAEVLKDTLRGLEKLECFLDSVEKLSVTSLHVFTENKICLSNLISLKHIQDIIITAQQICPLLLEFKRDAKVFFLPKEQNVEVLVFQLDRYILTAKNMCEKFEESCISGLSQKVNKEVLVEVDVHFPKHDLQKMLRHITQLDEIRKNQHFRMLFLFQEVSCSDFINEFEARQSRMLRFLNELEECAVQLDSMNKGAKISSVTGSSVGVVGGVLSIAGLALIPYTAGLSAGLLIGGTAMGITSGVNSAVTTFTEMGVNKKYQNKANKVMKGLMKEMQSLQQSLKQVTCQPVSCIKISHCKYLGGGARKVVGITKSCHSLSKEVSDLKLIRSTKVARKAIASSNISKVATDVPDVGKSAFKGTLAASKSARAGLIALNSFSICMDIFFICKDSISLAKGSKTEVSEFIRARAALWSSEIDSWKKIYDSLCKGLETSGKKEAVLETPFYPDTVKEEQTEKLPLQQKDVDEVNEKQTGKKLCVIQ